MKRVALILLAALMLALCGCNTEEEINEISYHVNSLPSTIDPQIASTHEELTVIMNTFEGLMKTDKNGNVSPAAAESYTVSPDGLIYTFIIAEGKKWSNESPLTANDFAFGIIRSVNPNTKSADKARLSAIKGAEAIMAGEASDDTLGVKVINSSTLQITLSAPCPQFLSYLSMPAFMPCNKEFFDSTNGKYGLDSKNTIFNGPYYVNTWEPSKNYISMRASSTYSGKRSCNFDTVMLVTNQGEKLVTDYNKGEINMVSADKITDVSQFADSTLHSEINTTCLLYINPAKTTPEMISALTKAINIDSIVAMDNNFTAKGIVPDNALSNGKNYRSNSGISFNNTYDPEGAYTQFVAALKASVYGGNFPKADLIFPEGKNYENISKKIAADWQSDLGAFVNIKAMPSAELFAAVESGNFTFALIPITSGTKDAADYMMALANSPIVIEGEDFARLVGEALQATSGLEQASKLAAAEKIAIDTGYIIPVCATSENYICRNDIYGKISYINGGFDFTNNQ